MATIYASAPGTGSGGSGTSGSPYGSMKTALEACSAGDTLILKTGVYTYSMAWNSVSWPSGTAGSPIIVRPETFTADTTRGIPAGTSSVIWRTGGGSALNMPLGNAYINFYGIDFDATNLNTATYTYISHNGGTNHIRFRNCKFSNRGITSGASSLPGNYIIQHIEYSNNIQSSALLNNIIEFCEFTNAASNSSHDIYCRSNGNIIQYCDFHSNTQRSAIQYFSSNGAGYAINDNIVRFNYFRDYGNVGSNQALILFSLNCNRNLIYANELRDSPTRIAIDYRGGSGITGPAVGNVAVYNTITNCLKGISIGTAVTGFSGTVIKNNIAYDNGSSAADNFVDNEDDTVDSNNAFDGTDPVFVGSGDDPYALDAGSPYLTSGVVVGSPYDDQDMLGLIRPQNITPTLGAYEYDAALTPTPPVNVYANPGGYTVFLDTSTPLPVSVIDDNSPSPLYVRTSFRVNGGGTLTIDVSGGGSVS